MPLGDIHGGIDHPQLQLRFLPLWPVPSPSTSGDRCQQWGQRGSRDLVLLPSTLRREIPSGAGGTVGSHLLLCLHPALLRGTSTPRTATRGQHKPPSIQHIPETPRWWVPIYPCTPPWGTSSSHPPCCCPRGVLACLQHPQRSPHAPGSPGYQLVQSPLPNIPPWVLPLPPARTTRQRLIVGGPVLTPLSNG